MANPTPVQAVEESFFRDFVDNGDLRIGESLLTDDGRTTFNTVMFEVRHDLKKIVRDLPHEREAKLLKMSMIQHAISQILSEIAHTEDDNKLYR